MILRGKALTINERIAFSVLKRKMKRTLRKNSDMKVKDFLTGQREWNDRQILLFIGVLILLFIAILSLSQW